MDLLGIKLCAVYHREAPFSLQLSCPRRQSCLFFKLLFSKELRFILAVVRLTDGFSRKSCANQAHMQGSCACSKSAMREKEQGRSWPNITVEWYFWT
eukprot:1138377-Pelagomonas_calceolata.AAC.3